MMFLHYAIIKIFLKAVYQHFTKGGSYKLDEYKLELNNENYKHLQ